MSVPQSDSLFIQTLRKGFYSALIAVVVVFVLDRFPSVSVGFALSHYMLLFVFVWMAGGVSYSKGYRDGQEATASLSPTDTEGKIGSGTNTMHESDG